MNFEKKIATRDGFGDEIVALGKENRNILIVDADIGKSCKTGAFRKELPEQYLNVGIAEQNCAGVAAGLATLRQLRQMDYDALERRVSAFAGELRAILSAKGVPIQMPTIASMFCPYFSEQEVVDFATAKQCDQQLFTTFYKQMRQQGIFLAPSGFETGMVSFAHTDDDFNKALDAARKVSF